MGRAGHLLDELLQKRLDYVRRGLGLEANGAPLDEHVRDQGEGEWMAVGEIEDGPVLFGGDLPLGEITPGSPAGAGCVEAAGV